VQPGEGARVPREGASVGPRRLGGGRPEAWRARRARRSGWRDVAARRRAQRECFDLGDFDRAFLPKLELKCTKW
jgi:hypothetical protein